jgi:hypothetical protein
MATLFSTPKFQGENLTPMEEKTLGAIIDGLYAEPGFSDIDANDVSKETEIPTRKLRGVLSSLIQKGYIHIVPTDPWQGFGSRKMPVYEIIYLNEEKYYLHPEWNSESQNS